MTATTPAEALAAALHADTWVDHEWSSGCCGLSEVDAAHAERLLEFLTDASWMVVPSVSLPDSAPKGDPATAAERIEDLTDRQWAVWWILDYGRPLTDEELVERYGRIHTLPKQTPQSIRSRRAELVRAGHIEPLLNRDGKQVRRPTSNGGKAGIWRAARQAEAAA